MKLIAHYPGVTDTPMRQRANWRENYLNASLYYSYRDTVYNKENFPSMLHYHDYYELLVYVQGDIHYISEAETYTPHCGDVILVPPGNLHMSMLDGNETRYVRHVFYFYPDALDAIGCSALAGFAQREAESAITVFSPRERGGLLSLLDQLDGALDSGKEEESALALSLLLRVFYEINRSHTQRRDAEMILPENVREIQRYIDENFAEITSVGEVAAHFYYSREYVSRLFKQYFNTTVADYLRTRRVAYSRTLIAKGIPLSEVCFCAGFGNLSTFIRSFHAVTGMTPSAYRSLQ